MKKILCFIDNLGSGGAQRQLVNLALILKDNGYVIDFVMYGESNFFKHYLDKNGITVTEIKCTSTFDRMLKVTKYLKQSDTDVLISFLETPGFLACLAKAVGARWKLLTSERSAKEQTFHGFKMAIYNYFERYSDYKVCNSDNARKLWEYHKPQYADKLRVIYNPVLIKGESIADHPDKRWLNIVVAASYQHLKNPVSLAKALLMLPIEIRSRLHIDWYGKILKFPENAYEEAEKIIKESNLGDCLSLNAETKDIYRFMWQADAIGLFSTVEGLPNAICEGMTLGKPIIMTRISDYDILVGGNGILCDPSPESIAEALKQFVELTPSERSKMGKISKLKAKSLFGKDEILRQWIDLIEN